MSGHAISVLRERKAVLPRDPSAPHRKGEHSATALQKSRTRTRFESMSVYVFPVRSLRLCRQLVHPPRAHARVHTCAHTYARLRRF